MTHKTDNNPMMATLIDAFTYVTENTGDPMRGTECLTDRSGEVGTGIRLAGLQPASPPMTRAQAKRILDGLKSGEADYSRAVIDRALAAAGEPVGVWVSPHPGWIDLRKARP